MGNFLTAIDFGSSKIAVTTGIKKEDKIEIVAFNEAPVEGIHGGEILNDLKVIETIKPLIRASEKEIGERITQVVINISGKGIRCQSATISCKRKNPSSYITLEEINSISTQIKNNDCSATEMFYDAIPQSFDVDDAIGQKKSEIVGSPGEKIEATFTTVIGKKSMLARKSKILEECGLNLKDAILSPIASARASLKDAEMDSGVALIDIGAGTTDIVIIKEFTVVGVYTIPFGGDSITNDIKNMCQISAKWAEMIKRKHGNCIESDAPENKKLILKSDNGDIESEVKLGTLSAIIEARATEILEAVDYIIKESGYSDEIPAGIVITGGSAYLENISYLAKAIFENKVRLAAPRNSVEECSKEKSFDAFSSTAVGLVLEGLDKKLSSIVHSQTFASVPKEDPEVPLENLFTEKIEIKSSETKNEKKKEESKKPEKKENKRGGAKFFGNFFSGLTSSSEDEDQA